MNDDKINNNTLPDNKKTDRQYRAGERTPGGAKAFSYLYHRGFRLRAVITLRRDKNESDKDPIGIAILHHRKIKGQAFMSVVYERGGDWLYADAVSFDYRTFEAMRKAV